jgi:hypothetical protein
VYFMVCFLTTETQRAQRTEKNIELLKYTI